MKGRCATCLHATYLPATRVDPPDFACIKENQVEALIREGRASQLAGIYEKCPLWKAEIEEMVIDESEWWH